MTDYQKHSSLDRHAKQTLENINTFIEGEGLKRNRLAKRLGMSESNFSDYLNGKRSNILEFSVKIAEILGLEEIYFMSPEFSYQQIEFEEERAIAFSAGTISEDGEKGLHQLLRVCELIEIYQAGDQPNA